MIEEKFSRRRLLQGALAAVAVPAATLFARSASAAEAVSEDDATAKSLGYVGDAGEVVAKTNPTYKPGQKCANCFQYKGAAGAAAGPCVIFGGKLVNANGWCKVWVTNES